jgi:hypothetical protein
VPLGDDLRMLKHEWLSRKTLVMVIKVNLIFINSVITKHKRMHNLQISVAVSFHTVSSSALTVIILFGAIQPVQ